MIKSLPAKDTRTVALSQAAGYLYNVKVAWRNPTMHPRITYTLEEAADLISAVKAFMGEPLSSDLEFRGATGRRKAATEAEPQNAYEL